MSVCLDDFRLWDHALPLPPSANSTSSAQLTSYHQVDATCWHDDACVNVTCSSPLQCVDTWNAFVCRCVSDVLAWRSVRQTSHASSTSDSFQAVSEHMGLFYLSCVLYIYILFHFHKRLLYWQVYCITSEIKLHNEIPETVYQHEIAWIWLLSTKFSDGDGWWIIYDEYILHVLKFDDVFLFRVWRSQIIYIKYDLYIFLCNIFPV